jgi:hypothetical protein
MSCNRRRDVAAKHKVEAFLQAGIFLKKLRLFTAQLRHFAGENIPGIASRIGANCFEFIAASRTPPWLPSGWGCRGRGIFLKNRNQCSCGITLRKLQLQRIDLPAADVSHDDR